MEFEIRSIDAVLRDCSSPGGEGSTVPPNLSFKKQGEFSFNLKPGTLIDCDGLNRRVLARIAREANIANTLPVGICEFSNVHVVGPAGLIIDVRNRIVWRGHLINWAKAFDRFVSRIFRAPTNKKSIRCDPDRVQADESHATALIVGGPGFGIYGHWLLDYLPRLHRAMTSGYSKMPLYFPTLRPWALKLSETLFPGRLGASTFYSSQVTHFERVVVPTTIRAHGLLEERFALEVWTMLDRRLANMQQEPIPHGVSDKIFVSRRKWKKNRDRRVLANAAAVEKRLEEAGLSVIYPETLSLAQQRNVFANAKVVVGEDGSGMHNTIFCRPGSRIGVIAMGRINTLHAMTANALGHHLTYIPANPMRSAEGSSAGFQVNLVDIDAAIDKLLDVARA